MSIYIVYESAALGLSLKIPKCSFLPKHSIKALGTIVDLNEFVFRPSPSRIAKIRKAANDLLLAVQRDPQHVKAKLIASFLGLIYSISVCCHRAAR